ALDLIQNVEVQAIIGPQKSTEATFIANLGDRAQVPIISFSATSPFLTSRTPYFVQATQIDSSQVNAISSIIQAFKWREVVLVYENSDYGYGLVPYLLDAFGEIETRVRYRSIISLSITDDEILEELAKVRNMSTRIFIVHLSLSLGSRLFLKVKSVGMMSEEYAWITSYGLMNLLDSMDAPVIASMQGVLGVKPYIPRSKELEDFEVRWKRYFRMKNPYIEKTELNAFGLWAYDTLWSLAMATERLGITNLQFKNSAVRKNATDITNIRTSKTGRELLKLILDTKLTGLSGNFHLANGRLQSAVFQILNVIGKGERQVAFWTPEHGISQDLKWTSEEPNKFRSIIWPGDSTIIPKGWPRNGTKLRVGVPVKNGFNFFNLIKVARDPYTKKSKVSGYCVDVFRSVMNALPYVVPYDFFPFEKPDGSSAGSYNDLAYQVYLQKFDAVVGDITITANRSLYVDFTLPYSEGGVSMIVPMAYEGRKNAWIFLKPLTKDLWLTSAAFLIFTGLVIWVLEHRINKAFRGPPSQHVGMICWFPLSTIVFAHRERVVSNLTRFVVTIWVFVVFVLNSSYTASLSSILTVASLQPAVPSIQELIENGYNVGYQQGSFIADLLIQLDFDESKLKPYNSPDECNDALLKGSQNGGIAAFFDTSTYIKLFLAQYCGNYIAVPIHKTDGIGFVFPKGSPLVADVSRAILNLTEGNMITEIERSHFGVLTACSDSKKSSSSLSFNDFRGLFIITGSVSGFALFTFLAVFLYNHMHVFSSSSENTLWLRARRIFKQFDERDLSSHHFKKTKIDRGKPMEVIDVKASPELSNFNRRKCLRKANTM
ncbi:hypothetical protein GIB67_000885, partial [Kingdonia uniflora]